jgi:hypothetical protein
MKQTILKNRARVALFWFTIVMILAVAVIAVVTILRMWGGAEPAQTPVVVAPAEVSLCTGERQGFSVGNTSMKIGWTATGGTISQDGIYMAGGQPGDYVVSASSDSGSEAGQAIVHVAACTPVPTATPAPTVQAAPTEAPTSAVVSLPEDARGDVRTYDGDPPDTDVPVGVDLRLASVAPDGAISLQPPAGTPTELIEWANQGEILLWMVLYEPVPDPPLVYTYWLFALDLDGDTATGRTPDSARINPDLGDEATVGVYFDPGTGTLVPDLSVWDPGQQVWSTIDGAARHYIDTTRTVVGLAVPYDTLVQAVADTSGVTLVPEAIKGRAGVLSYAGDQAVVDFSPDRPR